MLKWKWLKKQDKDTNQKWGGKKKAILSPLYKVLFPQIIKKNICLHFEESGFTEIWENILTFPN